MPLMVQNEESKCVRRVWEVGTSPQLMFVADMSRSKGPYLGHVTLVHKLEYKYNLPNR